ncbi:hypothetical protein [Pseudomonas farris]
MTKKYEALVVEIDEVVEDSVVLLVNGVIVKCFASYCPFKIELGKQYEVEFDLVLPDCDFVVVAQETSTLVEMIGDGFSCALYGYLDGSVFRSFVDFADQEIHYEYPHLNEQYVKITVDRIDVSF